MTNEQPAKFVVPVWDPTTITAATRKGPREVPALVHDWCPGIAVAMTDFGLFTVTHIASGMALGGRYERWGTALLEAVEWQMVAEMAGFSFAGDMEAITSGLESVGERPVPFPGATSNGEPMATRLWWQIMRGHTPDDEYPWETASEAPENRAMELMSEFATRENKAANQEGGK